MKLIKNYIASSLIGLSLGCATVHQTNKTENEKNLTIKNCYLSKIVLDQAERFALLACSLNGNEYVCTSAEFRYDGAKKLKEKSCKGIIFQ